MDPGMLDDEVADQSERTRLQEIEEEIKLFDLDESSMDDEYEESEEHQVQFCFAPPGIEVFKNDIHTLYREDNLLWPFRDGNDPFLSSVYPKLIKEFLKRGFLMREVTSTNLLLEYVFHTMCCTSDEDLSFASYNTLMYLTSTSESISSLMDQLCPALINLGADLTNLKIGKSEYHPVVIPKYCEQPQSRQMNKRELKKVLMLVLRFLSACLATPEKHATQHPDEFILLLIALGLDPKVMDMGLDAHIGACISHSLSWYPTDEEFLQSLRCLVKKVLEYCGNDVVSVVHLCRAYIIPSQRSKIFQTSLTFQQLQVHLDLPDEDFVHDVQAKNVLDLLSKFFQRPDRNTACQHKYYIMALLELCFHDELLLQLDQRSDILKICDLVERETEHIMMTPDDTYSIILSWFVTHVKEKWKRTAGIQGMDKNMKPSQSTVDKSEENAESQRDCKDQVELDVRNIKRKLICCKINDDMEANEAMQKLCSDSAKGNTQCKVDDDMEVNEAAEKTHSNGTGEENQETR